jgi:hypothetical protein
MRQYDSNKNGVLEKDEWENMRGDWSPADANRDTRLSIQEITNKLAGFGGASKTSSSKSTESSKPTESRYKSGRSRYSSSRNSSKSSSSSEKKSYRFKTVAERLPKDLPDWFKRNDVNQDGQIMMSEYSTAWSELKVREFRKYDLNDDGVITPQEYVQGK